MTPLHKGWSPDRKFIIATDQDERLLLRLAPIEAFDRKQKEYEIVHKYASTGIPMSQTVDFGVCGGGTQVYQLLTWVHGEALDTVLPTLSRSEIT